MAASIRIVLLGSHGLLGSAVRQCLAKRDWVVLTALGRAELNLANPQQFERVLAALEFDVLVNCAACTAVDDCEIQGDLAYLVNGRAPGMLARIAARQGARMVQFSTDYVFDGSKGTPYTEEDPPNPLSVYGKSKLMGEQLVLEAAPRHLVVRLSWLFGMGRPAFPDWIISKALQQDRVEIVSDKSGSPTCSRDAAEALLPWMENPDLPGGVVHFCNPPACSWAEYGQAVLDAATATGIPLQTREITPISIASLAGLTAPRPPHSAMSIAKYQRLTGRTARPWREALREYVAERHGTATPLH
ncbi:MAG: dTDP-4-dehydrorhamnose reductase [Verrucomicrobiales bacterium]|nr:dTDP-4-dehydrorhamnose reductase [Verrucomicrobiales bacterium]